MDSEAPGCSQLSVTTEETNSDENLDETKVEVVSLTFKEYSPKYVTIGHSGFTNLQEGSALSYVHPPQVTYKLAMEEKFYNPTDGTEAVLNNAQLEVVVYASQALEKFYEYDNKQYRYGFLLGDSTGVGKTRQLGAIIYEHYLKSVDKKFRVVWVSVNRDMLPSVASELSLFSEKLKVDYMKNITKLGNVVCFTTYSSLTENKNMKKLDQLIGSDYDGFIIFDEAHNMKSAICVKSSTRGRRGLELQNKNPRARILYASATGASEVNHLMYMERLGMWGKNTPFSDREEFKIGITQCGTSGLELCAMQLKRSGLFMSRQISFHGVCVEPVNIEVSPEFRELYRKSSVVWIEILKYIDKSIQDPFCELAEGILPQFFGNALSFFQTLTVTSKIENVEKIVSNDLGKDDERRSIVIGLQHTGEAQFKLFDKKFFNKGKPFSNAASILRQTINLFGYVVGCPRFMLRDKPEFRVGQWQDSDDEREKLHSVFTNDSQSDESDADSTEHKDVATKCLLESPGKYTPPPRRPKPLSSQSVTGVHPYSVFACVNSGVSESDLLWTGDDTSSEEITMSKIIHLYHELYPFLPINPMDELVSRITRLFNNLHKTQEPADKFIANGTGHRQFYFRALKYSFKKTIGTKKEEEIKKFMDGERRIIIISDASSTGVSLHADKKCKNQEPRTHITLELGFSPDRFLQQIGRSHRANQAQPPKYVVFSGGIPAEARFTAIVAKRLEQLGAICQGTSHANPLSEQMSSELCSNLGLKAIRFAIDKEKHTWEPALFGNLLATQSGTIRRWLSRSMNEHTSIISHVTHFLNRILIMDLDKQELFMKHVDTHLKYLKENGHKVYSPMIEFPNPGLNANVQFKSCQNFSTGGINLEEWTFEISRILSYETIQNIILQDKKGRYMFMERFEEEIVCLNIVNDTVVKAYYPYSKLPFYLRRDQFSNWTEMNRDYYLRIERIWTTLTEGLSTLKCIHAALGRSCSNSTCTERFGVTEIQILRGDIYQAATKIIIDKDDLQIACVKYFKDEKQEEIIGLLLMDEVAKKVKGYEAELSGIQKTATPSKKRQRKRKSSFDVQDGAPKKK